MSICYIAVSPVWYFFPGMEERHNFEWISKPFSGKENPSCDDDRAAKIEFLQLHEDARFETDIIGEDIEIF